MKRIAVIGGGIMGNGIATNFLNHGYKVTVWNRSKNKLKNLINLGAKEAKTPKEAALNADIIFEVTAKDESSRFVWLGKNGIIAGANPKKFLITNATLSVSWVDELASYCEKKKLTFFDMPMTGGRIGAETGKLVLLVGGDPKKLEEIKKDLKAVSEEVIYFGKAGSGMRFKLLLNTLQAIHLLGFGEVLRIAGEIGLDIRKVGKTLSKRPGGHTTILAWRDYQQEPDPINFSMQWITKDLVYTKKSANKVDTPFLDKALFIYKKALKKNFGQKDWTFINKLSV